MLQTLQHFFESSTPLLRLVFALSIFLLAPRFFQAIKLPGILGLILAGVLFGPNGLHLFKEGGQALLVFALLGKLLLLFFSGLDTDVELLRKNLSKSLLLALLSFVLPSIAGLLLGFLFGFPFMTAFMIAILFSSHSIIAYPILSKLGIAKHEAISVTTGATAITDITSLMLFAICIPIHTSGFLIGPFLLQVLFILGFIPVIIIGLRWLGKVSFQRLRNDSSQQMIFLLIVVGISAFLAEVVNIEPIVGAFLAGLAVSTTLPEIGVRNQLDTLGNTLFIPAFFISLGLLIDPALVLQTIHDHFLLVISVIGTVLITKFLAAWIAGKKFGYTNTETALMASLTFPQVSSTLAVALVAYESMNVNGDRLIDEPILNSILVLMVISSVTGTITTELIGKRLASTI